MSKYGFEKGDLLKYIDYVKNESYVGLYLRPVEYPATGGNDIVVLGGVEQVVWNGWQCDKLEKGEGTCK